MMHLKFKLLGSPLGFVKLIYNNLNFTRDIQHTHKYTIQSNHITNSTSDIAIYCVSCKRSNSN